VGLGQTLVVAYEASLTQEPGEGALDHPAPGQDRKAPLAGVLAHDIDDYAPGALGRRLKPSLVAAIGEDQADRLKRSVQAPEDVPATVAVLDARRGDHHDEQQADRVADDVALSAVDFFSLRRSRAWRQRQCPRP